MQIDKVMKSQAVNWVSSTNVPEEKRKLRMKECRLILKHLFLWLYLISHLFFLIIAKNSEQISNSPVEPSKSYSRNPVAHGAVPTGAPSESEWSALLAYLLASTYMCRSEGKCCLRFIKMMNAFSTISLRKWRKSSTTPESTRFSTSLCSLPLTACSWTWRESTAWPTSKELWIFSRRSKPVSTLENNHFFLSSWGVWQQGTYGSLAVKVRGKGRKSRSSQSLQFPWGPWCGFCSPLRVCTKSSVDLSKLSHPPSAVQIMIVFIPDQLVKNCPLVTSP